MALQKLERKTAQSLTMGKEGLDEISGILIGARTGIGRFNSTLYTLRTKTGVKKVWGNPSIDEALLDETGRRIIPGANGSYVQITVAEMESVGDNGAVRAVCEVAMDPKIRALSIEKPEKNRK